MLKETDPQGALYDFHEPAPISRDDLLRVHAREYVDQVLSCTVPHAVAREIGFPMTESVSFRAQCATGGSLLTAMLALEHGVACNTAGGPTTPALRRVLAFASSMMLQSR